MQQSGCGNGGVVVRRRRRSGHGCLQIQSSRIPSCYDCKWSLGRPIASIVRDPLAVAPFFMSSPNPTLGERCKCPNPISESVSPLVSCSGSGSTDCPTRWKCFCVRRHYILCHLPAMVFFSCKCSRCMVGQERVLADSRIIIE